MFTQDEKTNSITEKSIKKTDKSYEIPAFYWSHLSESNGRPTDYKSVALPAELKWHFILNW